MKTLIAIILLITYSYDSWAGDDYLITLEKVINSIELGKGSLKIDLNAGVYKKNLNGVSTFLSIESETSSLATIEIRDGQIFSLNYAFSKPVLLISGSDGDCYGLYVRSIFYQGTTIKIDSFSNPQSRRCIFSNKKMYRRLQSAFTMPKNLYRLLNGEIFGNSESSIWNACRSKKSECSDPTNLVKAVSLQKIGDSPDGFAIKFRPDSKIILGDSRTYENYVITGSNDNLLISQLSVIPENKNLLITLSGNLQTLKSGMFQSKGCRFSIDKPILNNILFSINNAGGAGVVILDGNLRGELNNTSFFDIGSDNITNKILIGTGSRFDIEDLNITSLANNSTHLKLGIGSSMSLNIQSAQLNVGQNTTLSITNSAFKDSKVVAEFFSEKAKAYFQGSLFDATLNVNGGTIALNDYSNLSIRSGTLHFQRLELNNTLSPLIMGRMDIFRIDLLAKGEYKASDQSFILAIGENSFISQKSDDPVRFEKDEQFPLGGIIFNFNLNNFSATKSKDFVLTDGQFSGTIKYLGNDQYTGRSIHIKGNLNSIITYNSQFGVQTMFDIDDGKLDYSKNFSPTFSGKISFQLGPLKESIPIQTPCKNDAELDFNGFHDEHLYPLVINLKVNNPIIFKGINFRIKENRVEDFYGASNPTSLVLDIPEGHGEYDADHDDCNEIATNVNNDGRGDDDIQRAQEIGRATLNVRGCTMHVWLLKQSYTIPYKINFEYKVSPTTKKPIVVINPQLDVSQVKLNHIRHGCDDAITGTIAGFFVDVDELLNNKIQETVDKLAEKISQGVTLQF